VNLASIARTQDLVSAVAEEVSSGIDRALRYWLGRIELEVIDGSLTMAERLFAIEQILHEYKFQDAREYQA
jgi:hypothetical protein